MPATARDTFARLTCKVLFAAAAAASKNFTLDPGPHSFHGLASVGRRRFVLSRQALGDRIALQNMAPKPTPGFHERARATNDRAAISSKRSALEAF